MLLKCQYIKKKIKAWLCKPAHVHSNSSFFTYALQLEANEPLLSGFLGKWVSYLVGRMMGIINNVGVASSIVPDTSGGYHYLERFGHLPLEV